MLEVKLSKFCVAIKFGCPMSSRGWRTIEKTKRVDTTDEAIGFRRSPITLTGLRAIAADARLAANPDQIRPASLLNTIAGAPRLLQLLSPVQQCRLGVVCAGAGFGKTTLLAQWHQQMVAQGERIAWLSLDEDDDDVWQFIPYLLQALRPLYADWDADFWRDMEDRSSPAPSNCWPGSLTSYTTARMTCT